MVRFVLCLWLSVVSVALARLRRGPLRPSWTFGYEVVTRAQKRFHEHVARLSPQAERRAWDSLKAQNPSRSRVIWNESAHAGVPSIDIVPRDHQAAAQVILYLHGGGFLYGSARTHGELASRIALAACARLVFPKYRLAPEHPFPAALDDARAVYRALLDAGLPPSNLVVAGDSAGGNLALALLIALHHDRQPLPAAAVLLSPFVDFTARSGSMQQNEPFDWASPWMFDRWQREYLQPAKSRNSTTDPIAPTNPLASPAHADARDLGALPPLLIQVGTAEMLYDQVSAFARRAKQAGVQITLEEYPDRVHLWHALAPMFPEFQGSIEQIGRYVSSRPLTPK